jgi:hypothetical protein
MGKGSDALAEGCSHKHKGGGAPAGWLAWPRSHARSMVTSASHAECGWERPP